MHTGFFFFFWEGGGALGGPPPLPAICNPDVCCEELTYYVFSSCSAVSKAYSVLSDDEKRNRYDRFGEEGLQASGMNGRGGASYSYAYEDEFDPNEIFGMFFGNNFSFGDEGE